MALGLKLEAGNQLLSSSAWPFSQDELDFKEGKGKSASGLVPNVSKHSYDVVQRDFVTWNIDLKQMGVGGDNSWGAPVHDAYKIKPVRISLFVCAERCFCGMNNQTMMNCNKIMMITGKHMLAIVLICVQYATGFGQNVIVQ